MTDKTMTEVRDWHLEAYKVTGQPKHKDMADAITRHLSQTAERGEAVGWQDKANEIANNIGESLNAGCDQDAVDRINVYVDELFALAAAPPPAVGVPDGWKIGAPAWPEQLDGWPKDGWVQMKDAIDVAAVREVIGIAKFMGQSVIADKLARAIGDAK